MANSVNVIVTSFTVTECCVNLFLSIMSPVLPLEVGGEYLIKLPLTSNGVTLKGLSENLSVDVTAEAADDEELELSDEDS